MRYILYVIRYALYVTFALCFNARVTLCVKMNNKEVQAWGDRAYGLKGITITLGPPAAVEVAEFFLRW